MVELLILLTLYSCIKNMAGLSQLVSALYWRKTVAIKGHQTQQVAVTYTHKVVILCQNVGELREEGGRKGTEGIGRAHV